MQQQRELRHKMIINMAFSGATADEIATAVHMHPASVRAIIRSPLAQAAFDVMREKAEASVTNVPLRLKLERELNDDAEVARRVQRSIMDNPQVDPRARLRASTHFLDRIVFSTPPAEERELDYRDVLRKLDRLEKHATQQTLIVAENVQVNPPGQPDA